MSNWFNRRKKLVKSSEIWTWLKNKVWCQIQSLPGYRVSHMWRLEWPQTLRQQDRVQVLVLQWLKRLWSNMANWSFWVIMGNYPKVIFSNYIFIFFLMGSHGLLRITEEKFRHFETKKKQLGESLDGGVFFLFLWYIF